MTGPAVDQALDRALERGGPAFEGWAVLELMGHRRLAGFVREVTLAGAGMLRIDVPSYCEGGVSAAWCPEHGDCTCGKPHDDCPGGVECKDNPDCPLHGSASRHGEEGCEVHATQFYSPASLYCLTPTTEREARRVAGASRPQPFVRYERPDQPALAAAPQADGDDGGYEDLDDDPEDPDDGDDLGEAGA